MKEESLFAYGTLQLESVQLATFGRKLTGAPDVLTRYQLSPLTIHDKKVIAISGKNEHTIARFTGQATDEIRGMVYELTDGELRSADDYEVEPCKRVSVILKSGKTAWVYVDGGPEP